MNLFIQMRRSQFLRHNTVFFLGSVAVGALNYLYYPILGRMLAPASFGEVQTLVSLFLQLGIFLSVLSLVTVNIVANAESEKQRNALVIEFEKLALAISLVLLFGTLMFRTKLQSFLQFDSSWPFVLLALSIVITVPFTLRGAFLRGKQRFGLASAANLVGAGTKLAASALLVAAGLGTAGAIGGLVLAQSLACALVVWWAVRLGLIRERGKRHAGMPNVRLLLPELKYASLVLVASLVITVQYSIDILVIKHYFDAHTAGLYAGIASVARIIFFLTASIALVLMPSVRLRNTAAENHALLVKSLALFGVLATPVLLLFAAFPKVIVGTLMGSSYEGTTGLLPRLSLAIFIISILNLAVSYYLALRRYGIAVVVVLGAAITYALMLANHGSIAAVVNGLLVGSLTMLGLLLLWAVSSNRRSLHAAELADNERP
jgi:O-antigen/teichoic acid export membrane protein